MKNELHKQTLATAVIALAAMTGGVLILTVISGFLEPFVVELQYLVAPAALLGLISPIIGYRLYVRMRDRIPVDADDNFRRQRFLMATVLAAAITESVALFGVLAFMLSSGFAGLIGVVTHVILVGAIWPTWERLATFMPDFP